MLDSAASCQIGKSATLTKLLEVEAVLPAFLRLEDLDSLGRSVSDRFKGSAEER